jgi:hypothetical protein
MQRSQRMGAMGLVLLAVLMAGVPCAAFDDAGEAAAIRSRRLVHLFDFDERKLGNYESMPMHWFVIGRPPQTDDANFLRVPLHEQQVRRHGFGPHSHVAFDKRHLTSGYHSFHLGINGGSAGAFLEVGAITAVPHSDYLITASVRTDPMRHARAFIVAYYLDVAGNVIDASRTTSDAIQTDGAWQDVSVRLLGDFATAAYIGMELILQQPDVLEESALGPHQVMYQEVRGGAWFDDIGVWQLPHVEVSTTSPVNVLRQTRRPELNMEVRDLTGQAMIATVVVYDHRMQPVASTQRDIGRGAPPVWRWTPDLPRHGWYLIDMQVRERRSPDSADTRTPPAPIARTLGAMLWLAPESQLDVSDNDRFAIDAEGLGRDELKLLVPLLSSVGIDAAIVSAWRRDTTLLNIESQQEQLDRLLATFAAQGKRVTVSLSPVPHELAKTLDIDPQNPAGMFAHPEPAWLAYLAPVLMRQGQIVRRWQVGAPAHPHLFYHPDLQRLTATIDGAFRDLAPDPHLVLPWSLAQARRPTDHTRLDTGEPEYALDVPPSIPAHAIAAHLQEWQGLPRKRYWLHLREPGADVLSHDARATDLALRMLHGWEAKAEGLALMRPWTAAPTRHTQIIPDPLLGVFTTVAHRLAGRRVVGRLRVAEGIECMILEAVGGSSGPGSGALAVWNRAAEPGADRLDMFLGAEPVAIDLWGNRTPVPLENNRHVLQLTQAPLFIEGIDPALAMFRATFKLDRPFIESAQTRHQRVLRLANPWNRTISGQFHLVEPADWQISPRRQFFSIAAGATAEFPVELAFPVSELSGPKTLAARFDFVADQRYVVDISTDMEVGLHNVVFDATLSLAANPETGKQDAAITMLITNTGNDTLALYAFANLVGYPRQERIVSHLQAGQSIVRRFTFPDAVKAMQTHTVRVGLRETNGPAVLNKSLALEQD